MSEENKAQRDRVLRRQKEVVENYKATFSSPTGKKVLLDLIRTHHLMSSTFNKDPLEMARMEGERNAVLRILTLLKVNPAQFEQRIREADEYAQSI